MTSRSSKSPKLGGEFRSGPVAGSTYVAGATFDRKSLLYAEVDGLAIFEGDIILGSVANLQAPADAGDGNIIQFSVGITGQQFRWPNAAIPYDIDPAMPNQQRITDAIAHWEANTRIRFVLRTAANAAQYPDFAHFQSGGGCSSMVGRRGGQQPITLGNGCGLGNAIHEIGHTVGLWHEQSREDRDTFVQIVWANVDPAMQFNFSQQIADGDDLGAYDYGSIMHYPATAFSINGQATIIPLQPIPAGVVMGQRNGLSQGDIDGVHMMYPPPPTIKEVRKDPLTDPTRKELRKDPISDPTIKELRKDPLTDPTRKELRKDPISDPTIKEVRKDPISDPTIKELRKDPISDPTIKEVRKDVFADPTIKEVGRDPIGTWAENVTTVPEQIPGFSEPQGASPFVMASPSRAGSADDAITEASMQVQELASALDVIEQQYVELMAAYEAALQDLDALQQGNAQ
jgi:hypothetical protein